MRIFLRIAGMFYLLSSAITYAHDNQPPIPVQPEVWQTDKVTLINIGGQAKMLEIGDKSCMVSTYLRFDVRDDYAYDIDETVEIDMEFQRLRGDAKVAFQYDKNLGTAKPLVITFPKDNATDRYRHRFVLTRARFAGRIVTGDFSIGGGSEKITVCDITLKRSNANIEPVTQGTLSLNITDENGKQIPARIGIYDSKGRMHKPALGALTTNVSSDPAFTQHAGDVPWPTANRRAFYIDGSYQTDLPVGHHDFVVARGPEYRLFKKSVVVMEFPNISAWFQSMEATLAFTPLAPAHKTP